MRPEALERDAPLLVPDLIRWLAIAALADWLLTRSLSRAAIFIPKSEVWAAASLGLSQVGLWATTLAGLLSFAVLGWVVWREIGGCYRGAAAEACWLAAGLLILLLSSVVLLFVPAAGWAAVLLGLVRTAVIAGLTWRGRRRYWVVVTGAALGLGSMYQLLPAWYQALQLPGPSPLSQPLFNLGEACVLAATLALWWRFGRRSSWKALAFSALPALVFTGMYLSMPAMAGILSIWSVGLTLYLPWPFYALALWAAGSASFHAIGESRPAGWAVLLLAAGGFASQLSTQMLYSLAALWLLAANDTGVRVSRKLDPVPALHHTHVSR